MLYVDDDIGSHARVAIAAILFLDHLSILLSIEMFLKISTGGGLVNNFQDEWYIHCGDWDEFAVNKTMSWKWFRHRFWIKNWSVIDLLYFSVWLKLSFFVVSLWIPGLNMTILQQKRIFSASIWLDSFQLSSFLACWLSLKNKNNRHQRVSLIFERYCSVIFAKTLISDRVV